MTTAGRREGRPRAPWLRRLVMWTLPVALFAGAAWLWLVSGRHVSTDDAFIKRDKLLIGAEVSGRIATVAVHENEAVEAGDLLFALDPEPFRIALEEAEAALAAARVRVEGLLARREQARAALTAARADLTLAEQTERRARALVADGNAPQSRLDEATAALARARQAVREADRRLAEIEATLGPAREGGIDAHPWVAEARASRDEARWRLEHAQVFAAVAGVVAETDRLLPGIYLPAGLPALTLLADGGLHVEANFKETDLTHMRPGQKARVVIDAWPQRSWPAHVESIGWATGAEFSLLPPENATGNWVKVVQRVPVRIVFDRPPPPEMRRAGLSVTVTVDTGISWRERLATAAAALGLGRGGS